MDLLHSLKVTPAAVVGHSSGEIAASYCAGFLDQESALRVAYFRGVLASRLARESKTDPWGMVSVGLALSEIPLVLEEVQVQHPELSDEVAKITISCMNCPTNTTVSGPVEALHALLEQLSSREVFARKLKVDVGYHSVQMGLVSADYLRHLSDLRPGTTLSKTKMVSSVIPGLIGPEIVHSGEYWVQNMVSAVRFAEAVEICCKNINEQDMTRFIDRSHSKDIYVDGLLEIGPHAALQGPLREILESHNRKGLFYASLLLRNKPADRTVLDAAGKLLSQSFDIDLNALAEADVSNSRQPCTVVDLPEYPFNHSVLHWEESAMSRAIRTRKHGHHPLVGSQLLDWNPLDAKWGLTIKKDVSSWVSDHRLHGDMWYPAAGMVYVTFMQHPSRAALLAEMSSLTIVEIVLPTCVSQYSACGPDTRAGKPVANLNMCLV